jgi:UDP-N-acetylmuramoyl-L-alanyl-D-glutamate--2,6-diaminopimelate ligase
MRLSKLIGLRNNGLTITGPDVEITALTGDSRRVTAGALFVAVPGSQVDGRRFIDQAVKQGAVAVLTLAGDAVVVPAHCALIIAQNKDILQQTTAMIAARCYPRQPAMIAAVTGTSGKTSTAQFMRELWALNGVKAASLGTLGLITPDKNQYAGLTTPLAIELHQMLDQCAADGLDHFVMEASSHGLALHRLDEVKVRIAGFTNLSRDHLDFHGTMENYFAAKTRLFADVLRPPGTAVLNADVPEFARLGDICVQHGHNYLSYGTAGRDLKILRHRPQATGQLVECEIMGKRHDIMLPVIGQFQIWNALCAAGMALASGLTDHQIVTALGQVSGVPGRLQYVGTSATGGTVFVDYAHKPDALENVLHGLRPHAAAHQGRLHVVFGCGGNRDAGKRPIMGEIAQRLADDVIVTDDNPRHEVPATIRRAILAGCVPGPNLREIGDRATAIAAAIDGLRQGDVLVIAGKGHESGQIIGDQPLPFDDAEVAKQCLGIVERHDSTPLAG